MVFAVIGSSGQLGSDIVKTFGSDVIPLAHEDIEVTDAGSCRSALKGVSGVINCAAFVRVDDCEDNAGEAFLVNAAGAKNVARACREKGILNVYISTDFVFDGAKGSPYTEADAPGPINVYGTSKYAGELFTRAYSGKFCIFRLAGLYGATGSSGKGGNFIESVIKKAKSGENVQVVGDIISSFTYSVDASQAMKKLLGAKPAGIYHMANYGNCSWFGFASEVFRQLGMEPPAKTISSKLGRKAPRPPNTSLDCPRLKAAGIVMRPWEDALKAYLREKEYLR